MEGDTTPVIRTYDLTKRFKKITAVDEVSFSVQRGEVFGFLGPNGAGKTTTIAMLLGLVHPTAGSAEVLGCDIRRGLSEALPRVGAVFETPGFYPYMSGVDNLLVLARVIGGGAEQQIPALLEQVGLEGRGADKVGTYSRGMRQRLGLAAALLGEPELLILDEPTNGLDPAGMRETRVLIRRLADEQGTTIFLSSHLLHEVEQVCDRVAILDKGRLIAQGRVDELLSRARGVEMRIDGAERAAGLLAGLDWVSGTWHEADRLRVQAPPERAAELVAALAAQQLFPSEVRPVISTLESAFLELTNDSGETAGA
ncbi:MAG: ABC transporter ATP-binding protein [Anaerolineales bacterium]|nr:MAG: ABC transporter ATP-binding protein [Anaerolineales bacterium]